MDPISIASLGLQGLATLFGIKSGKKAAEAAKLDPETQRLQNQALQLLNQRVLATNPLFERLLGGMQTRLPASYSSANMGGVQPPSLGQMRSPNMGQALSRLSGSLPGPTRRRVRQDQA